MLHTTLTCFRWAVVAAFLMASSQVAPGQNINRLLEATAVVRGMDEAALVALVPQQSGLHFVGCPNCNGGRQEQQLGWNIKRPNEIECNFCKHRFPSEKYPMKEAVFVNDPRGKPARFEYWADKTGYRYFFQARRDDEVRKYLAGQTLSLARLFAATGDKAHARCAAVILDRFAQVFPAWCYHYDYPFKQKVIYSGNVPPAEFRSGFRTARWTWWAYMDIPTELVEAYQLIRNSGVLEELSKERGADVEARIRDDLFRNAGEQVIANRDELTNMSPHAWKSLIILGRAINEPRYVHEVVRRLKKLIESQFFYDGFWCEGSPSYGSQTLGSLDAVMRELQGYSDPPGYIDAIDAARFDKLELRKDFPLVEVARSALAKLRLPDGRGVPVHDTWATARRAPRDIPLLSEPSYLLPALGHACLRSGVGPDRSEFHFSWSGGYGHQHADLLSLMVFSNGRELISDLGYTHTAYRSWTIATASHNTVVIDGINQAPGSKAAPTDGTLQFMDVTNPRVQVVSTDAVRAYPGLAKSYRRTLLLVNIGENARYAIDLFEVEGGQTHDYFLQGDADDRGRFTTNLELQKLETLLPHGFQWTPTRNEGEVARIYQPYYAYGFLRQMQSANLRKEEPVPVDWHLSEGPLAGMRVTLLPEANCQLVIGENPSIRQAHEDDSQLERHQRPFLMVRHRADAGRSTFVSLMEPFAKQPYISSAKRIDLGDGAVGLVVTIGERTDIIVIGARTGKSVAIGTGEALVAHFRGEVGVLTIRDKKVEHAYSLGDGGWRLGGFELTSRAAGLSPLVRVEPGSLVVAHNGGALPTAGEVVRLLTGDGWVYPYNVKSATAIDGGRSLRMEVAEGPGLEFDASKKHLRLRSFPQREHAGAVFVEWLRSASHSREKP